jgi:hypothetical protein
MRVLVVAVSVFLLSDARADAPSVNEAAAGTKENPIPIALGQKLTGRLDDNSPRSFGNRHTFYRLSALKGQTIVIGYECDIQQFYGCLYSSVIPEKSLGFQVEPVDAPLSKAFRYTLRRDNPRLQVWSTGTVNYTIVVLEGAPGETLWAETKAARARYDQAVARQKAERSAERAAVLGAVMQGVVQGTAEAYSDQAAVPAPTGMTPAATNNAAAAPSTPASAPVADAPVKTAYVMCLVRDDVEKRTYYSQIANLDFPLDRVARKNAAYFKEFVIANHRARADLTFLTCDYSFNDRNSLERQQSTNRAIDGRTGFATIQTSWSPQPVE